LAAQAGLAALQRGGNAVDAALAAAITLTVVEPVSNGVGGDLFALVGLPDADAPVLALNASGRAPGLDAAALCRPCHDADDRAGTRSPCPARRWAGAGCRNAPAACRSRPLFDDAIRLADEGFAVTPVVAAKWAREASAWARCRALPRSSCPAAAHLPWATALPHPAPGRHAARDRGRQGSESFYRGRLAHALARRCAGCRWRHDHRRSGRRLGRDGWVQPLHGDYRGHRVHQLPPNGQGITTLIALGILQHVDSALHGSGSAKRSTWPSKR
jgi:gamma-glutamyltranspeptidase/glutathione hydrolase